jgi:hypothetical protein
MLCLAASFLLSSVSAVRAGYVNERKRLMAATQSPATMKTIRCSNGDRHKCPKEQIMCHDASPLYCKGCKSKGTAICSYVLCCRHGCCQFSRFEASSCCEHANRSTSPSNKSSTYASTYANSTTNAFIVVG